MYEHSNIPVNFPPYIVSLPILGGTSTLPPFTCQKAKSLYFKGISLFFVEFLDFPFKSYKISKYLPHHKFWSMHSLA